MNAISRAILSVIFFLLTALLIAAAIYIPDVVFSIYPELTRKLMVILGGITSPFPFAVWEVLLLVLVLWAIYTLIRVFIRRRGIFNWLAGILLGFAVGLFCFVSFLAVLHV